jgi:hypothetical protein
MEGASMAVNRSEWQHDQHILTLTAKLDPGILAAASTVPVQYRE